MALAFDQRGPSFARVIGGTVDIGATEFLPTAETIDLAMTVTVDNETPLQSEQVVFTITVMNNGPSDATGVVVEDQLPAGLNFVSANSTAYDSGTGLWTVGELVSGRSAMLLLTASVDAQGSLTNTARVHTADQSDDDPGNNQSSITLKVNPSNLRDFGDAPTAAQSGLSKDYPVTLAQDGARHKSSSLFLGAAIDTEINGIPDTMAAGDDGHNSDDEDGIGAGFTMISGDGLTRSSFFVTYSALGKLDGWIDFNRDGDWDDPNEQIYDSIEWTPDYAPSLLATFDIPAGASPGATAARFRISSTGGLTPTGEANDGEVEDYMFTIEDGDTHPDAHFVVQPEASLRVVNSNYVYGTDQDVMFQAGTDEVGRIRIAGTEEDDTLTLDFRGGQLVPSGGMVITPGLGHNTLVMVGDNENFDMSRDGNVLASSCSMLDLSDPGANIISLDSGAVTNLSPPENETIRVRSSLNDELIFKDATDWRMGDPIVESGEFLVTANNSFIVTANNSVAGGDAVVESQNPRPWHNFVQASDVTNDGKTTAIDALVVINELGRRAFSGDQGVLDDPLSVATWPGIYYDQNADSHATALDALRVINQLARIKIAGGETSGEAEPLTQIAVATENPATRDDSDELAEAPAIEIAIKRVARSMPLTEPIRAAQISSDLAEILQADHPSDNRLIDQFLSDETFLDGLITV